MSLRQRIVLTLLGIAIILVIPAAYGLLALEEVHSVAHTLQGRDVEAINALSNVRNGVEAASDAQVRYSALGGIGQPQDFARLEQRLDSAGQVIASGLTRLGAGAYREPAAGAAALWDSTRALAQQERALIRAGDRNGAETLRRESVAPAFERMAAALEPIGVAIDTQTEREVQRAEDVAGRSVRTTLAALAVALALTLVLGTWLTRTLLRPVGELRRGMATVAEGDFAPDVRIPVERTDELGDLARSFDTMTKRLLELDRLKAEFVSVASHEIKTPLSVIRGYVTLLADGIYGPVSEKQRSTLEAVNAQTDRLTRLVHRLLDVSRFEAGGGRLELRDIDLDAFFRELTSGFQVLAGQSGIDFPVHLDPALPPRICGDEDRLNEVLGNLLSNAFKFTSRGGTIRMDALRCDGGICVEVEDTGVGIPPDQLPRVFEKFYQVDNDAQPRSVGSGLGLAISREIVEAHGGTITAESEVGRGTRFRVFLPERPPAQKAA
jgi:signal transduction histidine kinase